MESDHSRVTSFLDQMRKAVKMTGKAHSEAGGEAVEAAVEGPKDPLVVPHVDEAGDAVEAGHAQVSHGTVHLQAVDAFTSLIALYAKNIFFLV